MTGLADWLEVYHDYTRPHPSVVLAEASKLTELKTGHPLKGYVVTPPVNGNGHKDEEPPACVEPPQVVTCFFDSECSPCPFYFWRIWN